MSDLIIHARCFVCYDSAQWELFHKYFNQILYVCNKHSSKVLSYGKEKHSFFDQMLVHINRFRVFKSIGTGEI